MLEEDGLRFDAFLKENDEKVQEAIKRADVEAKAKQDKVRLSWTWGLSRICVSSAQRTAPVQCLVPVCVLVRRQWSLGVCMSMVCFNREKQHAVCMAQWVQARLGR